MKVLIPLLFFFFTFSVFGQADLPEMGKLSDLNNDTKLYLIADNESRKAVLKQFKKQNVFTVVDKSEDAEFFIEYKTLSRPTGGLVFGGSGIVGTSEIGQMDVFIYREKKKVIAWSGSTRGMVVNGDTANRLIKQFLKAVEKGRHRVLPASDLNSKWPVAAWTAWEWECKPERGLLVWVSART